MSTPFVSIIVNNYNYGRFLEQAIDSALAQTWPHREVIVVDDGSTDDSRDRIARYGDRIVPVLKPNGGQMSAFNAGFRLARGEIILFLDSDDALMPAAVATVVRHWRPGLSKIQYRLAQVDGDGRFLGRIRPKYPAGMDPAAVRRDLLATGTYVSAVTSGNAYGRDFLARILPLPEVAAPADGHINLAAPLYGDVLTLPEVLAWYRVHGNNAWATGVISPERFARYVQHDEHKARWVADHARALGIPLTVERMDNAPNHLLYRLIWAKLRSAPKPGLDPLHVALRLSRTLLRGSENATRKYTFSGWAILFALSPRPLARRLAALRLQPEQRPELLKSLIRLTKAADQMKAGNWPDYLNMPRIVNGAEDKIGTIL